MADSTITPAPTLFTSSPDLGNASLTAAALMGAVMSGGNHAFVKDVQEKIKDVTTETRAAQANLKAAQQKAQALQAQLSGADNNKKATESDKANAQSKLELAKQEVSNRRQVVANLQAQLSDLINRALPEAQRNESAARQQNQQRSDSQRAQAQEAQANKASDSTGAQALEKTLRDGLEASKGAPMPKGGTDLPAPELVDRTAEFTDVKEGEENFNDKLLAGENSQSPAAYASTKKNTAANKAPGGDTLEENREQAPKQGAQGRSASSAPAASGLPGSEEPHNANMATLMAEAKALPNAASKQASMAGQNAQSTAAAGATQKNQAAAGASAKGGSGTAAPAPRATGGASAGGAASTGGGTTAAAGGSQTARSASNSGATTTNSLKVRSDSGLSLPDSSSFAQGRTTGRASKGDVADAPSNALKADPDSNTISLGGVNLPMSKEAQGALTSPTVTATATALRKASANDPAPMRTFLQASQPDGRPSERVTQDTVRGYNRMSAELGLTGGGQGAAAGGNGKQAGGVESGQRSGEAQDATDLDGGGALGAAAKMGVAVTGTQQASAAAGNKVATQAGQANKGTTGSKSTGATASTSRNSSGSLRSQGAASARAVVLGKVSRRQEDEIDPFDSSDVDTGGMSDEKFAKLTPLEKVMTVVVKAAEEAQTDAASLAAQVSDNTQLKEDLRQQKTDASNALRAAGVSPDDTTLPDGSPLPQAIVDAQKKYRSADDSLSNAADDSAILMIKLQTAVQVSTTYLQAASNVSKIQNDTSKSILGNIGH